MQQPVPFAQGVIDFDREALADTFREAEEQRLEVIKRFPLEHWPAMTLQEYALGQEDSGDTFCRWIEFKTRRLGILAGATSRKHLIFKRKHEEAWYYDPQYANENDAWEHIRAGFVQMFDLAGNGEWESIEEIQALRSGGALRAKTLHVYWPTEILPITSRDHIVHFLHQLDPTVNVDKTLDIIRLNRSLLAELRQRPEVSGWTTNELMRFLYHWADPRELGRVVKIAPGEGAKYWDDCLAGGYICVGWDKVGDLREFESKEAFFEQFAKMYGERYDKGTLRRKANEVWTLAELEPGDVVVANKGKSQVLALGEVVEPGYEWRPARREYQHTVNVKWDTSYGRAVPTQSRWGMVTVGSVPAQLYEQILRRKPGTTDPGDGPMPTRPVDPLYLEIEAGLQRRGQVILYGPPGTGKTYTARRFAAWWLLKSTGSSEANSVLADKSKFETAILELSGGRLTRRVWWVVANPQEWSWDQLFAKGSVKYRYGRLRRNYPLVQRGDLVVGYQSTPAKRIVALARVSKPLHDGDDGEPRIELVPVRRLTSGLSYDELQSDPTFRQSEPIRFRNQGTLFALTSDEADALLARLVEREPEAQDVLKEMEDGVGQLTQLTFHPSYGYEDFVEGFRPVQTSAEGLKLRLEDGIFKRICREAKARPERTFLVLIDEINRANVAKVFGELITLLELDKRGVVITLPQSKEPLSVPPNVYIIATMNTADRSVKLLDAALRRRFAFIELMPDVDLLTSKVGPLPLHVFLDGLNQRIARKEGREKQIGHSFLLDGDQPVDDPKEFARRFRHEILPLLQEYCYDEYDTLAGYLGSDLVDADAQLLREDVLNDDERLIDVLAKEFGGGSGEES